MDLAFRTRDLARSAIVSGISGSRNSGGGIGSGSAAVTVVLGTAATMGAKSDAGADGAVSIDPVGSFFLGFGRGFFVATAGSALASPFDVEATAWLAITVLVLRGSGCRGFAVFRGGKGSGSVEVEGVSQGREKVRVETKEQTFWAKEIFLVLRIRNEVSESHVRVAREQVKVQNQTRGTLMAPVASSLISSACSHHVRLASWQWAQR